MSRSIDDSSEVLGDDLSHIIAMAPVGMVVSRLDGSFVYANPAIMDMLGYQGNEIYCPDVIISHPDEYPINQRIREALQANPQEPIIIEKHYVHKNGHSILGLASIVSVTNKDTGNTFFVAQIINITEHKKMEKSVSLFRSMINSSTDIMLTIDPLSGDILDCNLYGCQCLGYSYQEMLKLSIHHICSDFSNDDQWDKQVARIRNTKNILEVGSHQKKDGGSLPVEMSMNYVVVDENEFLLILSRDITERNKNEALLQQQASYDSLTHLPNRYMFYRELKKRTGSLQISFSLLLLNIDSFKEVNDTLGSYIGDQVLVKVSERILDVVGEDGVVTRVAGDEFGIIFKRSECCDMAQKLIASLSEVFIINGHKIYISCCVGICIYPSNEGNVDELVRHAGQALKAAKVQGRGVYQLYDVQMGLHVQEEMLLGSDIHTALRQQQFIIEYQPIFCMLTGDLKKAEALIRWQHPRRGLISPEQFIHIAEGNGTIEEIGNWILRQVVCDVADWREQYQADLQISINTSPLYFREGNDQLYNWRQHLQEAGLPGEAIALEITENLLLDTRQHLTEMLLMLRDAGIQVALDDFGTGYSSLAYLKELDVDYLKIDKSFVENLASGTNEQALCEAIVVMAHKLNLRVIAEGVETQEQYQLLKSMGCDYAQGFLLSKPVPSTGFSMLLQNKKKHF